jgi:type II secretory pathway component HofQ
VKYLKLLAFTILFISTSVFSESAKNISLNFTDTQSEKLLKIIADFSNKGLVLPSSKLGKTSAYFKDTPWDEALEAIAKSANLEIEVTDHLIVVSKQRCSNRAER